MYWNSELETIDRRGLERLQFARLKKALAAAASTPFYKKVFSENGVAPSKISTLEHLKDIPFTTKNDLRVS